MVKKAQALTCILNRRVPKHHHRMNDSDMRLLRFAPMIETVRRRTRDHAAARKGVGQIPTQKAAARFTTVGRLLRPQGTLLPQQRLRSGPALPETKRGRTPAWRLLLVQGLIRCRCPHWPTQSIIQLPLIRPSSPKVDPILCRSQGGRSVPLRKQLKVGTRCSIDNSASTTTTIATNSMKETNLLRCTSAGVVVSSLARRCGKNDNSRHRTALERWSQLRTKSSELVRTPSVPTTIQNRRSKHAFGSNASPKNLGTV